MQDVEGIIDESNVQDVRDLRDTQDVRDVQDAWDLCDVRNAQMYRMFLIGRGCQTYGCA